jgi:hypothetical protein
MARMSIDEGGVLIEEMQGYFGLILSILVFQAEIYLDRLIR